MTRHVYGKRLPREGLIAGSRADIAAARMQVFGRSAELPQMAFEHRKRTRGARRRESTGMLFALREVTYERGGRVILPALTVNLEEGMTALVGPSGAGKSTLLRLLNRLADPDSATIHYREHDVRDYDVLELRREVALVPQLPALMPGSVAENVGKGRGCAGGDVSSITHSRWPGLTARSPSDPRGSSRLGSSSG